MNKIKKQLIFAAVFSGIYFIFSIYPVYATACQCANGSLLPTYYPKVGDELNLPNETTCNQRCFELSSKYYFWDQSSIAHIVSTPQNNQTNVTAPCVCSTESKTAFFRTDSVSAINCANICQGKNARYYIWGNQEQQPVPSQPVTASTLTDTKYSSAFVPMEEIPGFGRPSGFPAYLMAVYKFGLWAVGICALLMISIGGYMYIASAGNKSTVETAKKIIFDALAGIILAMVSWLLLYLINPDLVKFM